MRKSLFRDRPCSGHASSAQHAPALPVPRVPAGLRGPGPESGCKTYTARWEKNPEHQSAEGCLPRSFWEAPGQRAASKGGAGFRVRGGAKASRPEENGL